MVFSWWHALEGSLPFVVCIDVVAFFKLILDSGSETAFACIRAQADPYVQASGRVLTHVRVLASGRELTRENSQTQKKATRNCAPHVGIAASILPSKPRRSRVGCQAMIQVWSCIWRAPMDRAGNQAQPCRTLVELRGVQIRRLQEIIALGKHSHFAKPTPRATEA